MTTPPIAFGARRPTAVAAAHLAVILLMPLIGCGPDRGISRSAAPAGNAAPSMARAHPAPAAQSIKVPAAPSSGIEVDLSGFERERLWSAYDDWEPTLAVAQDTGDLYQLTTRLTGPDRCPGCKRPSIIFRRSRDGGRTWEADRFLAQTPRPEYDPQIATAAGGRLYAAYMDGFIIRLTQSSDRGLTWTKPLRLLGRVRWGDKPWLLVSPDGRDVYVGFNSSDSYITVSHDYGQTFSAPKKTNHDKRYWFHTGGAIAADGTVYFAAVDYTQNYSGDSHINVIRSTDGGATWQTVPVDTSKQLPGCSWDAGCYFGYLGPSASLAVDSAGQILIAYNAGVEDDQPQRLFVRTSHDGLTWSDRTELSVSNSAVDNAFAGSAAGPHPGDFRVVWQDDRNDPMTTFNTWYRRTTDGGTTWSEAHRLSDVASGAAYKTQNGFDFFYGDYLGIAVDSGGRNYVIWGEGASWNGPGGTWYTRGE